MATRRDGWSAESGGHEGTAEPLEVPLPEGEGQGEGGTSHLALRTSHYPAGDKPPRYEAEEGEGTQPSAVSRQPSNPGRWPSLRRGDFVVRTIADIAATLEHAVFSEESARLPGLLQRLDARAKIGAGLMLVLAAALARHIELLLALSVLSLLLAGLSRLSVSGFARRVWLGVPLFAGMMVLPSLFLAPGRPLLVLVDSPALRLALTDAGLYGALLLVARVGASVSLALLLVSTTRWADLLRGLAVLRIPQSFLMVLAMTYRYLFLFLRAANNLFLARQSRTVGASAGAEQRQWAATAMGTLVSRSLKLSGDVLLSMRARGFDGDIRKSADRPMRDVDWLLLSATTALVAVVLLLDRVLG